MKLIDREHCTGCGACMEACPKQTINFQTDDEGFPFPDIDENKCIECGQCGRVCPAVSFPVSSEFRAAYAAQTKDREVLEKSTSGGVFTAFAREIFRRKGIVYGCVWDQDYNAVITAAEDESGLDAMHGSKYVWSWAGDTFPEIKKYLTDGRIVLFFGLACQVAGLKKYLGKDYENLYLASFFCGGTPSPLALKEYVKSISTPDTIKDLKLNFRDKRYGGVGVHVTYTDKNGRQINQSLIQNSYYFAFYSKVFNRRSCYSCQYRYKQRVEDITIGDYWGVGKYHQEFDVKAGVSALLINTDKGEELLNAIRDEIHLSETKAENIAPENNLTLSDNKVVYPYVSYRDGFFNALRNSGWKKAERKYLILNEKRIKLWIKWNIPLKYRNEIKRLFKR